MKKSGLLFNAVATFSIEFKVEGGRPVILVISVLNASKSKIFIILSS